MVLSSPFKNPKTGQLVSISDAVNALNRMEDITYNGVYILSVILELVRNHSSEYYAPVERAHVIYDNEKFIISFRASASKTWRKKEDIFKWFKVINVPYDAKWMMKTLVNLAASEDLDEVFVVITFNVGANGAKNVQSLAFLSREVGFQKPTGLWRIVKWFFADSKSLRVQKALGESRRSKVLPLGTVKRERSKSESREKRVKVEKKVVKAEKKK